MTSTPRHYQTAAIEALLAAYDHGRRACLFVHPTGVGKTSTFIWLIEAWAARGGAMPALICAHREELVQQAVDRVTALLPEMEVEIEKANRHAGRWADIVVASVQTISQHRKPADPSEPTRLRWLRPGIVILDEAAHAVASSWQRVVARYARREGNNAFVVGCTATPKRLDKLSLHAHAGGVFEEVTHEYSMREAIADGWLCPLRGYQVRTHTDLTGVGNVAGDFNQTQLGKKIEEDPARTEVAIDRWQEVAAGRQTIAFAVNVAHARAVAEAFRARGVAAESVDGTMRIEDRRAVIDRFRHGETMVIANCEVLTEGFDAPATSCALMMRPTQSWSLFVQMVGRCTRIHPGKADGIVLDVVDVTDRHDLVTLPAVLDLPCKLDLEGRTLTEAAKALEDLGAEAACLQGFEPASFTELQNTMRRIDLFRNVEPSTTVLGASQLAWLAVPGGYALSCGTTEGVKRQARLTRDPLGDFHVRLSQVSLVAGNWAQEFIATARVSGDERRVFADADALVLGTWPDTIFLAGNRSRWRQGSPTDKQVELLKKFGVPGGVIQGLSRGAASGLISQYIEGDKERRPRRDGG